MAVPNVMKDTCTGCEACVDACPSEAIKMVDGVAQIDPDMCSECMVCVETCPVSAIVEGQLLSCWLI